MSLEAGCSIVVRGFFCCYFFFASVDLVPRVVCIQWFDAELLKVCEKFMDLLMPIKFY